MKRLRIAGDELGFNGSFATENNAGLDEVLLPKLLVIVLLLKPSIAA